MSLARAHIKALADGEKIHLTDIISSGRGRIFWVMAAATSGYKKFFADHNVVEDGTNSVYNTIDAAINACTASRGDVIYVTEGYSEAVTSTSITCDVAGVTFIGLGRGSNKATLTFGATNSVVTVSAANCEWRNFRLQAGIGDVVTAFLHVTAAQYTRYVDMEFYATSTFNFINGYTLGAANISDGCRWISNYLRTADAGQLSLVVTAASQVDLKFYDNCVSHAATVAGLLVGGAADFLGLTVLGNYVQTGQTDGSGGVVVSTSSTASSGVVADNDMKTADAAANVAIPIASKVYAARNYIAGADEVGTVVAVGTLFDNA